MTLCIFVIIAGYSGVLLSYMLGNSKLFRAIPVSLMGIVTSLYVFGLLGLLKAGVIVVDVIVFLIYFCFLFYIIKRRSDFKLILKNLSVPFVLWAGVVLFLYYCDRGMMAHNWDEFSHWASTVKAMFLVDDFATNSQAMTGFKSYPPAMSVLQYFFERNNVYLTGKSVFADWILYLTYHVFCTSFLFPIFDSKELFYRRVIKALILFFTVILFFCNIFDCIYIDPFVGIIGAYFILSVLHVDEKDKIYRINLILTVVNLVLAKDIGLYFAVCGAVFYMFCIIGNRKNDEGKIKKILDSLLVSLVTIVTKTSWNIEMYNSGVEKMFSGSIDFPGYMRMLFLRDGADYRQTVVDNSVRAFFEKRFYFSGTTTSYFVVFIILTVLLFVSSFLYVKKYDTQKKRMIFIDIMSVFMTIFYIIFIGAMYAYKFSEYEGINLISYERYMNIVFLCYALISVGIFMMSLRESYGKAIEAFICVTGVMAVLVIIRNNSVRSFVSRDTVRDSILFKDNYSEAVSVITQVCNPDDEIYFVSAGDDGIDRLAMEYYLKPYKLTGAPSDLIGEGIAPSDWVNILDKSSTHVYLYRLDDTFREEYSTCFYNVNDINENTLYYVDKKGKNLVKAE